MGTQHVWNLCGPDRKKLMQQEDIFEEPPPEQKEEGSDDEPIVQKPPPQPKESTFEIDFPKEMPPQDTGLFCTKDSFDMPNHRDMDVVELPTAKNMPKLPTKKSLINFVQIAEKNSVHMVDWSLDNFNTIDEMMGFVEDTDKIGPKWDPTAKQRFKVVRKVLDKYFKRTEAMAKIIEIIKKVKPGTSSKVKKQVSQLLKNYRRAEKNEFLSRQEYAQNEWTLARKFHQPAVDENVEHDKKTAESIKKPAIPKKKPTLVIPKKKPPPTSPKKKPPPALPKPPPKPQYTPKLSIIPPKKTTILPTRGQAAFKAANPVYPW